MLERPGKPPKPPPSTRQQLKRGDTVPCLPRADLRRERKRRQALKAARDARHRERLKQGKMMVLVEVSPEVEDWLIRIRWLTEAEADAGDARIIGERIAAGLAASAKGS